MSIFLEYVMGDVKCQVKKKTVMYCPTDPVSLVQNICGVGVERNKLVEILNLYRGAPVSAWLR